MELFLASIPHLLIHWHLIVHWLDVFRHDLAFSWAWYTWVGNITAGIIISFMAVVLWPPCRRRLIAFVRRELQSHFLAHIHPLHNELIRIKEHHEAMQQSHDSLHEKLDAILGGKEE